MKTPLKERILWPVLTVALTAVLILLGTLQYRWSKEVSDATSTRLRASLTSSMLAFRQDLARELSNVMAAFQPAEDGRASGGQKYAAEQFREWKKTSSHPGLVKAVYIVQQSSSQKPRLLRLNQPATAFEPTAWPAELTAVREGLPRIAFHKDGAPRFRETGRHGRDSGHGPAIQMFYGGGPDGRGELGLVREWHEPDGEPHEGRANGPKGSPDRDHVHRFLPPGQDHPGNEVSLAVPESRIESQSADRGAFVSIRADNGRHRGFPKVPWVIDTSVPALISLMDPFSEQDPDISNRLVIELDQDFLRQHIFPELVARYFPNSEGIAYDVAVVDEAGTRDVYASGKPLSPTEGDARLDLVGPAGPPRFVATALPQFQTGQRVVTTNQTFSTQAGVDHPVGFGGPPLLPASMWNGKSNWILVVKNRQGSLEAAVARLRTRELAVSFGILIVLAATMGLMILASRRAHRLAKLQMDFVAGVSHELRTPLAVISSAADNMADGVIESRDTISRYGKVIQAQSSQLRQLVEQILLFAATRHRGQHYTVRPTRPESVIDLALENTAELIRDAQVTVETDVPAGLSPVLVDAQPLVHCLQNLIINAVKYGGQARWLGISAGTNAGAQEVTIAVRDHGIGIEPEEFKQVFDPFYRGAAVRSAQIHGSGLGLPLAKSIVEAMGGRITVESTPGSGSVFTLHLPIAAETAAATDTAMSTAINPKPLAHKP